MKKLSFIIIVTLFSLNATGQVWIDSGAVWHYDYLNVGYWGFYKYEYVQDTLIQGKNCQKIIGSSYAFTHDQYSNLVLLFHHQLSNNYTFVSGDTVFYLNNGEFFVLFNFGATIGDNWIISTTNPYGFCDDTSRVEVIDTGKLTLNSVKYRFIKVQPTSNSSLGLYGTYVERFGSIDSTFLDFQNLFPGPFQCDSLPGYPEWDRIKFKCFADNSFTMYNPSTQDCEYYLTLVGIHELDQHDFILYPNPTSGLINIDNSLISDKFVEIYNYQGSLTRSLHLTESTEKIDISDLKTGIYFLRFKDKANDNCIIKIIKE